MFGQLELLKEQLKKFESSLEGRKDLVQREAVTEKEIKDYGPSPNRVMTLTELEESKQARMY